MNTYQAPKLVFILRAAGGLCLIAPLAFFLLEGRRHASGAEALVLSGIGVWAGLINFGIAQILVYAHRTATLAERGGDRMPEPPPIDTLVRGAMHVPPAPAKPSVMVPPPPPIEDGNP